MVVAGWSRPMGGPRARRVGVCDGWRRSRIATRPDPRRWLIDCSQGPLCEVKGAQGVTPCPRDEPVGTVPTRTLAVGLAIQRRLNPHRTPEPVLVGNELKLSPTIHDVVEDYYATPSPGQI